jgi:hypothetical protein
VEQTQGELRYLKGDGRDGNEGGERGESLLANALEVVERRLCGFIQLTVGASLLAMAANQ